MRITDRREADKNVMDRRNGDNEVIGHWLNVFRDSFYDDENRKRAELREESNKGLLAL